MERINGDTVLTALYEQGLLIRVRAGKYLGFVVYRLNWGVRYSFGPEWKFEKLEKLKRKRGKKFSICVCMADTVRRDVELWRKYYESFAKDA